MSHIQFLTLNKSQFNNFTLIVPKFLKLVKIINNIFIIILINKNAKNFCIKKIKLQTKFNKSFKRNTFIII